MTIIKKYFSEDTNENYNIISKIKNKKNFNISNKKIKQLFDTLNMLSDDIYKDINVKLIKNNNLNVSNNIFISYEIKKNLINIKYVYVIKFNKSTINLYVTNKNDKINLEIVIQIYYWLSSFKQNNKKCTIDIYLLSNKKLLNNEYCLSANHVNSGSTTNKNYIQIWRKEELLKVLIHELIHLFGYDYYDINNITNKNLNKLVNINISNKILPNEAYVDCCTIILHSIYISNRLNKNSLKLFKFILTNEIYFCLYQTAKIIKHYGFYKIEDLFDKNNKNKICQSTSVFSYYIIKSSLLFNLDKFLDFIKNFNLINFIETDKNLINFNKLIIECLTDKNYHKEINKIIEIVQNSTLRMSLFQFKH